MYDPGRERQLENAEQTLHHLKKEKKKVRTRTNTLISCVMCCFQNLVFYIHIQQNLTYKLNCLERITISSRKPERVYQGLNMQ